jgi:methyltransferase (TIGR00027 family)
VGRTAFGVAMIRALESRRKDRLFHDPYATAFLAAAQPVFDRHHRGALAWAAGVARCGPALWSHVVIRTRFFDDYLADAAGRGIRQVVLLASGLDTRAYRLAWPAGVRLFELDLPEMLAFKRRVLDELAATPQCDHRTVAADLREDWVTPLARAGLRRDEPTAWLPEGLFNYLSADETTHVLTALGEQAAAGSRVAFEHEEFDAVPERALAEPALAEYAAMWKGGLPDTPGWLAAHGWSVDNHYRAEVASRYGRTAVGASRAGFVTATRA